MNDKIIEQNQDDNFFYWKKGSNNWLGNWFKENEFSCKCDNDDCIDQKVSKELIIKLEKLRFIVNTPIRINSGFRCAKHQESIRESGISTVVAQKSSHEEGLAVDMGFSAYNPMQVMKYIEELFDNIGVAINYVHVDTRPLKADGTKRRWKY